MKLHRIVASTTLPHLWLTLRENGTVIIHVTNLQTDKESAEKPFRVALWRPRTRVEREAINKLIRKANTTTHRGTAVSYRNCFSPLPPHK